MSQVVEYVAFLLGLVTYHGVDFVMFVIVSFVFCNIIKKVNLIIIIIDCVLSIAVLPFFYISALRLS